MQNPTTFPEEEAHFMLEGPVGNLEVKTAAPKLQAFSEAAPVTVICCHPHPLHGGTMENKVVTTVFRTFRNMGTRVVRFNYRGVGQSEGEYADAIGETDDLLAIIQWLKQVRPDDQIWLVGFSFGSNVVTRAASQVDIKQLITIAPAVDHLDFQSLDFPACPWLVIQGDADEVVSPQAVYTWVDTLPKSPKLVTLEGVSHFFHGRLLDLRDILETEYKDIIEALR